eukprot:CAMPEP_0205849588 /NCGR_PEP_ID=MMETSP1019-20131125/29373_1 /ASSEMBLY_ACC=CAM_ASM_000403 /TAXON_ID=46462 /ORGANISM="Anophryoides haemophila, Strain AH6" /LENGTH=38 /DNA_ID= /DNA_START= /DNA_END= /DNA_ORIENTATION=
MTSAKPASSSSSLSATDDTLMLEDADAAPVAIEPPEAA